ELLAGGGVRWNEMKAAGGVLAAVRRELGDEFGRDEAKHNILSALDCASAKTPLDALSAAQNGQFAFAAVSRPKFEAARRKEEQKQLTLARDIFGNSFRPVAFDSCWRTADVRGLARAIYEDRAFDR